MSSTFLEEIKKRRACLKPQTTIVTSAGGEKHEEKLTSGGELRISPLDEKTRGFIVDDKPDLQMAEITPFLYLSSQDAVQDVELLTNAKVTHILSVGIDIPADVRSGGLVYKKIDLLDLPESNLVSALDESFEFIDGARFESEGNRVLVHCNAGYSRSPSIIIAYLMKSFQLTLDAALEFVGRKRCVRPNAGFMNQLKEFEMILKQQRKA